MSWYNHPNGTILMTQQKMQTWKHISALLHESYYYFTLFKLQQCQTLLLSILPLGSSGA
jgi:hypothetical protein